MKKKNRPRSSQTPAYTTTAVLLNPSAGGGRALRRWQYFSQQLGNSTCYVSKSESDFRDAVRRLARNHRRIAVCGGDSSLAIAAEELAAVAFRGELLFLPAGSANDIARHLSAAKKTGNVYLGRIQSDASTRIFLGQANWGMGVIVNRQLAAVLSRLPFLRAVTSGIGFCAIVANHLMAKEVVVAEIQAGKEKLCGQFSSIVVSQIRYWASGMLFAPGADWHSTVWQVVAIRRCPLLRFLRILWAARQGQHLYFPEVAALMATRVEIRCQKVQWVQCDGEVPDELAGTHFFVTKRPSGFRITTL
ncbi:MAG: diacylglycerol kinase family protein [Turneriella sp.]|nr:diacylglycerol kinase family protein [Turneriella sp.]